MSHKTLKWHWRTSCACKNNKTIWTLFYMWIFFRISESAVEFVETNCMKEISSEVYMLHFNKLLSAMENDGLSGWSHKLTFDHKEVSIWSMVDKELLGRALTEFLAFLPVLKFHKIYKIIFNRQPATLPNS